MDTPSTPLNQPSPPMWLALLAHRALVSVIVLTSTAVGAGAAYMTTPVYRATVVVLPADSRTDVPSLSAALGSLGGLGSLVGLGIGEPENTVEALALLNSRDFAESFIRDHKLMPKLFPDRWDPARSTWRNDRWSSNPPTLYDGYRKFDRKVRHVSEDKKAGLVTLEIDWTNAAEGAQWANEMILRVNETMRQRTIAESDASIDLLTGELQVARTVELQDAIARTIDTYIKARALAKVRREYAFRIIDPGAAVGPRDYIRPNTFLYIFGGICAGVLFAILTVFVLDLAVVSKRPRTISSTTSGRAVG